MHTHILDFSVYLYLRQHIQHNTQPTPLINMNTEVSLYIPHYLWKPIGYPPKCTALPLIACTIMDEWELVEREFTSHPTMYEYDRICTYLLTCTTPLLFFLRLTMHLHDVFRSVFSDILRVNQLLLASFKAQAKCVQGALTASIQHEY